MDEPRGRYSRGYLPHIDDGQATQFVTFRLADSMPSSIIRTWREELAALLEKEREREMYRKIEAHLDAGHGSCVLKHDAAGSAVQSTLLMYAKDRYFLHEWVVMPNHVHALLTPRENQSLAKIMQSIKGHSARQIHLAIGGEGRLWQPDYFDRLIRDEEHFEKVCKYIAWNPVKAKLCNDPTLWVHSSANPKFYDVVSADSLVRRPGCGPSLRQARAGSLRRESALRIAGRSSVRNSTEPVSTLARDTGVGAPSGRTFAELSIMRRADGLAA